MFTKLDAKSQITLPKSLTQMVGPTEYLDVEARSGQLVLTPVGSVPADATREKLSELGITEADMFAARDWARTQAPKT